MCVLRQKMLELHTRITLNRTGFILLVYLLI